MVNRKRKIFIHNFEMMASIGVYENEKKNKQKIIINLDILLTNSSEPKADDLMETQDYSQFRNEIKNKGIQDVSKGYEAVVNFIQSDLKW